ncbi:MAG: gamma-glutamyltransferase [Planctomycetota bacterium]|nr:gamma-glutamyltransferase [Planctomycetota bacterium]
MKNQLPGSIPAACSATGGVVVAAFPGAAEAGALMLRRGGTAADAACAAAFALGVCEPAESGLGGQTTLLVRSPVGRTRVIDGHSRAPAALTRARVRRGDQDYGIQSAVVPSTVSTLAALHAAEGRLPWSEVLAPAISLAMEGFAVTALQRQLIRWTRRFFAAGSIEAQTFLRDGTLLPRVGNVIRQPLLGVTLERLARDGACDFTRGGLAREIVADMEARGGLIRMSDLALVEQPAIREPLAINYRGRQVLAPPPPAGGVQLLLALQLLEQMYDPSTRDVSAWYVAMARALHVAFRERERWPDHPADMSPSLDHWLVSRPRAAMLLDRMQRGELGAVTDSMGEMLDESEGLRSGNTTHLCVWDSAGCVVSLTQSIQSVFGAKTMHPTLGFVYNNYLSTCPRRPHPYRLGASCIPQSNATPTIVLDGNGAPQMALGSAGSRRITNSVLTAMSAMIDHGDTPAQALARPRAHALLDGSIWAEQSVPGVAQRVLSNVLGTVRPLEDLHYKLGAVQAIARTGRTGELAAAADPRRDGAWSAVPSAAPSTTEEPTTERAGAPGRTGS